MTIENSGLKTSLKKHKVEGLLYKEASIPGKILNSEYLIFAYHLRILTPTNFSGTLELLAGETYEKEKKESQKTLIEILKLNLNLNENIFLEEETLRYYLLTQLNILLSQGENPIIEEKDIIGIAYFPESNSQFVTSPTKFYQITKLSEKLNWNFGTIYEIINGEARIKRLSEENSKREFYNLRKKILEETISELEEIHFFEKPEQYVSKGTAIYIPNYFRTILETQIKQFNIPIPKA